MATPSSSSDNSRAHTHTTSTHYVPPHISIEHIDDSEDDRPRTCTGPPIVLVTGASSGLGAAIARTYAASDRSARLLLAARNRKNLEEVAKECRELGSPEVHIVEADVTNETACRRMCEAAIEHFDGLDVLVLCAGINAHCPFVDLADLSVFHELMNVNFFGYLNCTYHALPFLLERRGQIVVVGSMSGEFGFPMRTAYCASKYAVNGFFEALRAEVPRDLLRITVAAPDTIGTEMRAHALRPRRRSRAVAPRFFDSHKGEALALNEAAVAYVSAAHPSSPAHRPTPVSIVESSRERIARIVAKHRARGLAQLPPPPPPPRPNARTMGPEECARVIVDAAANNEEHVYFSLKSRIGAMLKPIFPQAIQRRAQVQSLKSMGLSGADLSARL